MGGSRVDRFTDNLETTVGAGRSDRDPIGDPSQETLKGDDTIVSTDRRRQAGGHLEFVLHSSRANPTSGRVDQGVPLTFGAHQPVQHDAGVAHPCRCEEDLIQRFFDVGVDHSGGGGGS